MVHDAARPLSGNYSGQKVVGKEKHKQKDTHMKASTIEYLSVSQLNPYPRNSRTHSKKQIRQIADSIRQFGFTNPLLIDSQNVILAGQGRLAAAKTLGLEQVRCVRL